MDATMTQQSLYCALTYLDAKPAITWLENTFGFVAESVYDGDAGSIAHALLRSGTDLIMLGSARTAGPPSVNRTSPKALGGTGTLMMSVYVSDIEATFATANNARAQIIRPLGKTTHDDTQTFTAADCEGYVWCFGTYVAAENSDISPCLRYEDPMRAIAWLRDVCGLEEKFVVPDGERGVKHCELSFGASVLMVGSRRDDDLRFDTPARAKGTSGSIYGYCADPDTMFARARSAGAEIIVPLRDTEYGSREFALSDPEGNGFSFGTYRP